MAGAGARRRALAAAMAVCCANALTPAVGSVSSATRTLTVIGTVHTPSAVQRAEVRAVIDAAQPDAVVVELDAERLETLWDRSRDATPAYGAELAEAVRSARARGALVVLGDAIKPVRAVVEAAPFLDLERIARGARLLAGATAAPPGVARQRLDVAAALASDPRKAAPLALSVLLAVVGAAVAAAPAETLPGPAAALLDALAAVAVVFSLRVADVLLLARDDVLSENALRALEMGAAVKTGALERFTFDFSRRPADLPAGLPDGDLEPFLTLRSPLKAGERRRVNLFEPRWLAMLDAIDVQAGTEFNTVHAVNRCYVAEDGRVSADVVVDPRACRVATVERVEEGKRPVSGDRRLAVWLVGGEAREARDLRAAPGGRGYLVGTTAGPRGEGTTAAPLAEAARPRDASAPVHVVAVVGLVHANPILARCAARGLRSASERGELDGEVMRAIRERERAARLVDLPWSDYDREKGG